MKFGASKVRFYMYLDRFFVPLDCSWFEVWLGVLKPPVHQSSHTNILWLGLFGFG
jgi:hypothetical protein